MQARAPPAVATTTTVLIAGTVAVLLFFCFPCWEIAPQPQHNHFLKVAASLEGFLGCADTFETSLMMPSWSHSAADKGKLAEFVGTHKVGWIVNERFINLPPQLAPQVSANANANAMHTGSPARVWIRSRRDAGGVLGPLFIPSGRAPHQHTEHFRTT